MPVRLWKLAHEHGISPSTLQGRLEMGWPLEEALSTPPRKLQPKGKSRRKMPEYRIWCRIKYRCNNPKAKGYDQYGGRGIKVCDRWNDFENFIFDMGPKPFSEAQIDRIDNDGNYEPSNCRWTTSKENRRNKQDTIYVQYRGETGKLCDFAEQAGFTPQFVWQRIKKLGWSVERALESPTRPLKRK